MPHHSAKINDKTQKNSLKAMGKWAIKAIQMKVRNAGDDML